MQHMTTTSVETVSERFLSAIATRDFASMLECFADDVQFRALVPRGLREAIGPEESTRWFQTWFGPAERVEALDLRSDTIGDRHHLAWRLEVDEPTRSSVLEQHAYLTVEDERIVKFDLVCSGFQPRT